MPEHESSTSQTSRSLNNQELNHLNELIQDFEEFEEALRPRLPIIARIAPLAPTDRFLNTTARRIKRLTDGISPTDEISIRALAELTELYQVYARMVQESGPIRAVVETDENLSETYDNFERQLRLVSSVQGLSEAIRAVQVERREAEQRQSRQRQEAQWVREITPFPQNARSRIVVGEAHGVWNVFKINRNGHLLAVHASTLRVAPFNFEEWYMHRGFVEVHESFARLLRENWVISFLYGLVEGFSAGIQGTLEIIIKIDETLEAIHTALSDLGETGTAIWQALIEWKDSIVDGSTPQRAQIIGRLIGTLFFELLVAKGVGRIAFVQCAREALTALRSRRVSAIRETTGRLRRATIQATSAVSQRIRTATRLLLQRGILRRTNEILGHAVQVGGGRIRIGAQWVTGTLYVTQDAYYFLLDEAREFMAFIGERLVARHRGFDGLNLCHRRTGRSSGSRRI